VVAGGGRANGWEAWLDIGVRKEGMEGAMQGVRLRALVGEEEELSHSPAEVDRDAHRCGLGKVQLMEGAIRELGERGMEVQERWQWLPGAQSGPF
jgi:hypothetical protein